MPKPAVFQPTRSDAVSTVSRLDLARSRAHGAAVHSVGHASGQVEPLSGDRGAQSHRGNHSSSAGVHVPAGTRDPKNSYPDSADSGFRTGFACFGIVVVLLCALTAVPYQLLHWAVEALR